MQGVILMAVYRPDRGLLVQQLESLKTQTLADWRCVVGIDGADAATCAVLKQLVGTDERFDVIEYVANVGHYRNFERLTREVRREEDWVAYCDQDDRWYPEKLEELVTQLEAKASYAAVVGAARIVGRHGNELGVSQRSARSFPQLLLRNEVTGSFTVFRANVVSLALPFPAATQAAVHDHWLGVCAAALGEIHYAAHPLQDYVQHAGNAIGEASRVSVFRQAALVRAAGGFQAYLERISRHQWGWRVSMARELRARVPDINAEKSDFLAAVAAGKISLRLSWYLTVETVARRVPLHTALALGAAALKWPRVGPAEAMLANGRDHGRAADRHA